MSSLCLAMHPAGKGVPPRGLCLKSHGTWLAKGESGHRGSESSAILCIPVSSECSDFSVLTTRTLEIWGTAWWFEDGHGISLKLGNADLSKHGPFWPNPAPPKHPTPQTPKPPNPPQKKKQEAKSLSQTPWDRFAHPRGRFLPRDDGGIGLHRLPRALRRQALRIRRRRRRRACGLRGAGRLRRRLRGGAKTSKPQGHFKEKSSWDDVEKRTMRKTSLRFM